MVAFPFRQRLILPIASTGGGIAAALVGAAMLMIPPQILEAAVMASGLPDVLAPAAVPLGLTTRIGMAIVAGVMMGSAAWAGLRWALGGRALAIPLGIRHVRAVEPAAAMDGPPLLRRSDAHPDAPPRRPLMAGEELGTPFLEVTAPDKTVPKAPKVQALPKNLEAPLAAFDPDALPEVPFQPVRAVPSLARKPVQAPGERFEVFELRPPVAMRADADADRGSEPILPPRTEATIHALLDRLERGVAGRGRPAPARGAGSGAMQDTLAELRQLAARAS